MDNRYDLKGLKRAAALLVLLFAAFSFIFTSGASASSSGSLRVSSGVPTGKADSCTAIVADYDECLTATEEKEILDKLLSAAKTAHCNIGIVITRDLQGLSDKQYADKFSDDNFGYGSSSVVLLLLNTYDVPEYSRYVDRISTSGSKKDKLQPKINRMFDRIFNKLGDPKGYKYAYNESTHTYGGYDYYQACVEFARCVKAYGGTGFLAITAKIADYMIANTGKFLVGTLIAVVIGLCIVKSKVKSYKRKKPISASAYMDRTGTHITRQVDQFVREYTTHYTRSSSSGGHGGGHGGGGHGGGGGHHR